MYFTCIRRIYSLHRRTYHSCLKLFLANNARAVDHIFARTESDAKLRPVVARRLDEVTRKSRIKASRPHGVGRDVAEVRAGESRYKRSLCNDEHGEIMTVTWTI